MGNVDVGLTQGVEHYIRLTGTKPFRERYRRIAPADIEDVQCYIIELLGVEIIKESGSQHASPIVITGEKNGAVRMCIDYKTRTISTHTTCSHHSRIDDAVDCLAGSKWFSVLDLYSGYYQIAMAEEDSSSNLNICLIGSLELQSHFNS